MKTGEKMMKSLRYVLICTIGLLHQSLGYSSAEELYLGTLPSTQSLTSYSTPDSSRAHNAQSFNFEDDFYRISSRRLSMTYPQIPEEESLSGIYHLKLCVGKISTHSMAVTEFSRLRSRCRHLIGKYGYVYKDQPTNLYLCYFGDFESRKEAQQYINKHLLSFGTTVSIITPKHLHESKARLILESCWQFAPENHYDRLINKTH